MDDGNLALFDELQNLPGIDQWNRVPVVEPQTQVVPYNTLFVQRSKFIPIQFNDWSGSFQNALPAHSTALSLAGIEAKLVKRVVGGLYQIPINTCCPINVLNLPLYNLYNFQECSFRVLLNSSRKRVKYVTIDEWGGCTLYLG